MRKTRRIVRRRGHRSAAVEFLEQRTLLSTIYSTAMDTSPGWTLDNVSGVGWSYGTPAGLGGDPSAGHTGTKVVGTIIASPGYYPDNVPSTYWAKTGAIDCSHYTGVTLDFWRWLGIEGNDRAYLEVSNNGTSWTTIWNNNFSTIVETAWSHQTYDISAVADHQSTVYVHWGLGPTNASVHYCGWNIDDVTVSGTLDTTPPTVSSINLVGTSPTNASSVQFTTTFSEGVTGVDTSDFALATTGTAGGVISSVSGSGSSYTVTVNSVAGDGALGLNLVDNDSILDMAGNKLGGTGAGNGNFTGQTYTVDQTAPLVSSINRAGTTPTNGSSVQFTATFSESVTGVDTSDFALATTGTATGSIASVSGSGSVYTITVNSVTGDGALGLNLVDNDTVVDLAGNKLGGTGTGNGNFTGQTYTINHTPPVVSSIDRVGTSPTNADSVQFAVTFSEFVTGVDINDFALARNHTTGTITSVTGSRNRYTVTVSSVGLNGTLGLNLVDDDSIQDMAGNKLGGTGTGNGNFTGQTYVVDNIAPVVLSQTPGDYGVALTSAFNVDVTFSEPVAGVDATDLVLTGRAAAGATVGAPSNIGNNTWRFPISAASDGSLTLTLAPDAGDITDIAGNNLAPVSWRSRVSVTFKIAYDSEDGTVYPNIWSVDADGSNKTEFTSDTGPASDPSYSHDGQRIVYSLNSYIFIANADGTGKVALTSFDKQAYGPVFSPDDSRIAFWDASTDSIWIMNADGSNQTRLTVGMEPVFSADGSKIMYVSGGGYLWLMNVDGSNQTNLASGVYDPSFSPDGSKIVFDGTFDSPYYQIYAMNANGTGRTRLTNDSTDDWYPRFSPDGGKVAFYSDRDGKDVIYTMNADGTVQTRLTSTSVDSSHPSWGVDLYPPSVISIVPAGSSPTVATTLQFTVTFSEPVWGVDASDFAVVATGSAAGTITSVSGSGATYTVTVNNATGDGTLGLNLVDDDSIEDRVGNKLGGQGAANGNFIGQAYTLDRTGPTVTELDRIDLSPTDATSVRFELMFSEDTDGVDPSDFALAVTGSINGTVSSVSGSQQIYYVTVSSITGNGTLALSLVDNDSITDVFGNPLGGVGAGNGNFTSIPYTIDVSIPAVVSISRAGGSLIGGTTAATWNVTFSEAVSGVDLSDFKVVTTDGVGYSSMDLSFGSGGLPTYQLKVYGLYGDGTIGLNLADDDTIVDSMKHPLGGIGKGNGSFTGEVYQVDHTPPQLTSLTHVTPSPTRATSIQWAITFSEDVVGVDLTDFRLQDTDSAVTSNPVVAGTGHGYTYTASASGTGGAFLTMINDGSITDLAGNVVSLGPNRGDIISIDNTPPTVTEVDAGTATTSSVQFSVYFNDQVTGVDAADFQTVFTGTASGSITNVTSSNGLWLVTVGNLAGDGTVQLNVVDNDSITDLAGNPLGGPGLGNGNFTGSIAAVDHTAPVVSSIARYGITTSPTNATQMFWLVTFSEPVIGVDASDFSVPPVSSVRVTGALDTYVLEADWSGSDATLKPQLIDNDSITDLVGNTLGGIGAGNGNFTGESVIVDHTGPAVISTTINTGAIQRSMVTQAQVVFSEPANLVAGAISIVRRDGSAVPNVVVNVSNDSGDQKTWNLTFSGTGTSGNSLPDGRYTLVVTGAKVTDIVGNVMSINSATHFFRLFGDSNGDRMVDRSDLIAFRQALNRPANYGSYFDYDNDGSIAVADYSQLRKRMVRKLL